MRDEDIRAGKLRNKYDVLLYPHVDLELAEQIRGIPKAWGPMPFKKTRLTPSHGTICSCCPGCRDTYTWQPSPGDVRAA